MKKADLSKEYNIHTLRHSHATLWLKKGISPKIIQERLGHTSISITLDVYSHVSPEMQKEAAEKMENLLSFEPDNS
ncbi:MAG: tyrosine-type recombinase/integrase [Bacillota bacterium]